MIVFFIILGILLLALLCFVCFVHVKTKPRAVGSGETIPIGGMVKDASCDLFANTDKKLARKPIVKLGQLLWISTAKKDALNHATQHAPAGIEEHNDIPYINDGNLYHTLDVYVPDTLAAKKPVIIDVHGGGWMYGDKELNKLYCLALASRGYVVFNMSYRLVPDVTVPEQLQDVMRAIKWISDHMDEYPCDRNSVILTGDSAGGMLASYAVVLNDSARLSDVFKTDLPRLPLTGILLTSPVPYMKPDNFMKVYTAKMWGSDYKKKATLPYMNLDQIIGEAKLPKTCLITSAGDFLAHDQTVEAAKLLEAHGVETKLMDFGGDAGKKLEHVFTVINPYNEIGRRTIDEALAFLR